MVYDVQVYAMPPIDAGQIDAVQQVNESSSLVDVEPHGPVNVLEESSLSDAVPQDHDDVSLHAAVTYNIVKQGSGKSRDVLTDSHGYSYTRKPLKTDKRSYWRCVVRNKKTYCRAAVTQDAGGFRFGQQQHICRPRTGVNIARNITAMVTWVHC